MASPARPCNHTATQPHQYTRSTRNGHGWPLAPLQPHGHTATSVHKIYSQRARRHMAGPSRPCNHTATQPHQYTRTTCNGRGGTWLASRAPAITPTHGHVSTQDKIITNLEKETKQEHLIAEEKHLTEEKQILTKEQLLTFKLEKLEKENATLLQQIKELEKENNVLTNKLNLTNEEKNEKNNSFRL
ncbi:Protein of unknown function [Gryllus bimaculatus]|nr:Protein of unknown function [Gryllus bimaculatus]